LKNWSRWAEHRRGLAEIVGRLGEHSLEPVEPLIDRILAPTPGRPFELGDCRVERMVLVMGRGAGTIKASRNSPRLEQRHWPPRAPSIGMVLAQFCLNLAPSAIVC
jgi:hypothetical protein